MAEIWKEMLVAPTQEGGALNLKAFEAGDSLGGPGNGVAILIPDDVHFIGVLMPGYTIKLNHENLL